MKSSISPVCPTHISWTYLGLINIDACSLFLSTCEQNSTKDHSSQDFLPNHHYWNCRRTKYSYLHSRSHYHHLYVHNSCLFQILFFNFLFQILFGFHHFFSLVSSRLLSNFTFPVLSVFRKLNFFHITFEIFTGFIFLPLFRGRSQDFGLAGLTASSNCLSWRRSRKRFQHPCSHYIGNRTRWNRWLYDVFIPCSFWIGDPEINDSEDTIPCSGNETSFMARLSF